MERRPVSDHSAVAQAINEATNYVMYGVYRATGVGAADVPGTIAAISQVAGLKIRGWYDVSGYRSDADVMVWWWADNPEALQQANRALLQGMAGRLAPVWSGIGVHRPAEFNTSHVPAFLAGDDARAYACVYPFVRGREWYLLPADERRTLLREHGLAARDYADVLANTMASFGLSDYEWLLAFEADELVRIVDLVKELRATAARRHVLEEVPFYTGPRRDGSELLQQAAATVTSDTPR